MIDNYRFGNIIINKISYDKDVIIFPDKVQTNWWRKEGHYLQLEDIEKALEEVKPNNIVIGTGKFGLMRIDNGVNVYLEKQNIQLHAESTGKAIKIFNRLILIDDKVLGAFHLTC
jgi:hypothetical protein